MEGNRKLYAAKVAAVAAVYYGAAKLGLSLAFESKSVTAVWPPTGIALAALVLWGPRMWPGVALGAMLANTWTGVPVHTVLGITVGNTLEAVVGAHLLLRRTDFRPSLERVRDVVLLALLAGGLSTIISATIGVSSLLAGNAIDSGQLPSVWRTWWLGDMGGDVVVGSALLIAATHWPFNRAPGRRAEALVVAALLGGATVFVFSADRPFTYLIFPPLIWIALRFWQPGAALASLLVAGIAITYTEADNGPFAGHSPDDRLLLAQGFVGVAAVTGLVLAAMITERRRVEDTVEYIAGTLQESLLPSRVPEIPGVETAVHFRPAGGRHLVGGDFYDVFEGDDGSWSVVIGDVCGKGAAAAAVTGLARYTLRAAAVQERLPSRVLELLNAAILRQRSPHEFCTAAFARVEPDGAEGARITLASGGHPLPLVLRADGVVEALGRGGTLLGVDADPKLSDHSSRLAPGDALVLYTDGLTDAYAPDQIVTPEDLSAILGRFAGGRASDIAAGVQQAVLGTHGEEPRDDIALMVLRVPEKPRGLERTVSARLAPEPTASARARQAIRELEPLLGKSLYTTVRLLVSELVTNSVRHSASPSPVGLHVSLHRDRVRVEVSDRGPGFHSRPAAPRPDRPSGWGLYLIDQLADRWGVDGDAVTRVWFEIDR